MQMEEAEFSKAQSDLVYSEGISDLKRELKNSSHDLKIQRKKNEDFEQVIKQTEEGYKNLQEQYQELLGEHELISIEND